MKDLTVGIDPILVIMNNTVIEDERSLNEFKYIIQKLYQYNIFKPMLDLVASKALYGFLRFKVQDQKFFDLDEGNCRTIEGSIFNKALNIIKKENRYLITIKKISAEVIVHEIAHMVEKEIESTTVDRFAQEVMKDISCHSANLSLGAAVQQIMGVEVDNYQSSHKNSELFARYFQLLAMSKEVAGRGAAYGFALKDVYKLFTKTEKWLWDHLYKNILPKIDIHIATQSQKYIKEVEDIEHTWAYDKVKPLHTSSNSPRWTKTMKSIKDDPFK